MPPRRKPLLAALTTAALALAATSTLAADTVTLVPNSTVKAPGGVIRGAIESETPEAVKIGGQAIPVDQVESITYDGQPATLARAEIVEKGGGLAEAADLYRKAAAEATGKPLVAQAAQFKAAELLGQVALGDPSKLGESVAALEAFLKGHPQSRHRGPGLELLARLHLQQNQADKADADIAELDRIGWAKDRAAVLKTEVLARRGKYGEAIKALDGIIASASKGSARLRDAQLAKAKDLAASQKYDEATGLVNEVIKAANPEDAEVQAVAWNTLGDCLRAANRPKDALKAYLHTDLLYDKNKEQHPRALHEIARLWRELKHDDRADQVLEELRQKYPQSPYLSAKPGSR